MVINIIIFYNLFLYKVFDGEFVVKLTLAFSKLEIELKKCLISSKDSERDNDSSSCYVYFLNNAYETVIYWFLLNYIISNYELWLIT